MSDYKQYFTPPEETTIWEWAERNVILSARQPTANHGSYRSSLTPYVRGILDAVQDLDVSKITICKGAQTGLTLTAYLALCYWICEEPGPCLVVMPTADLGRSASETRIQPLIEDSPRVSLELTDERDNFKKLEYVLRRSVVNIVGSNSPANLASRPAKYLILDETDKYPDQTSKEARAINLAIERTKTFWDKKILEISTPTTQEGYIHASYEKADQRKYYIPCQLCGHMQYLRFGQIKFDANLSIPESAENAYYECEECKGHWSDTDKINACDDGAWRATSESSDVAHVSFHLPSFYAPWVKWKDVVVEFRNSKSNPAEYQNFVNSCLGEVWVEEPKDNIDMGQIWSIRDAGGYARGTIPTGRETLCFMTVDVQKRYFPWCWWACDGDNLWLVDHGLYVSFDDVMKKHKTPFRDANGTDCYSARMILDTGYGERTTECYEYCFANSGLVPIKGDTGTQTSRTNPFKVSAIFPKHMKKLSLMRIHPDFFKFQLLDSLHRNNAVKIWFHGDIDRDFVEQITGEVVMEEVNSKTGVVRQFFKVIRTPQDYFDCAQYAFAALYMGRGDVLKLSATNDEPPKQNRAEAPVKVFVPPTPLNKRKRVSYG